MKQETRQAFLNFNPKLQREIIKLYPELKEVLVGKKKKNRLANWGNHKPKHTQTDWKEQILSALDIKDVMQFYGVEFNSRGFANCPFHSEKTASLSIKDNRFKCFGCGAWGNVIDFVMLSFSIPFMDAIKKLDNDFRLNITNQEMTLVENDRLKNIAAERDVLKAEHMLFREHYMEKVDIFRYLNQAMTKHSPENQNPANWHPVYVYAVQNIKILEQWLDDYQNVSSDIKLYEKFKQEGRLPYWEML